MTIAYSGTSITYPDNTTQASAQIGMKNRIINGGFTINQVGYVSGTALAASAYPHDMYKAGASGCTYTFTQGTTGVNTQITITAGSLIQIIEGVNLPEGGTYVLSWTGTAQARLNNGTFGSSGTVTVTGWIAGTNLPVEFNTGTVGGVQLEVGSVSTTFDYRPYGYELSLCQRYFQISPLGLPLTSNANTSLAFTSYAFPIVMRASPTVIQLTTALYGLAVGPNSGSDYNVTNTTIGSLVSDPTGISRLTFSGLSSTIAANAYFSLLTVGKFSISARL